MDAHFHSVVQTFPFAGPVPRAFFWKGNVSLAPCVDATNVLYIRLNSPPLLGAGPAPRVLSASLGTSRAFSSPILTSKDQPLEHLFYAGRLY